MLDYIYFYEIYKIGVIYVGFRQVISKVYFLMLYYVGVFDWFEYVLCFFILYLYLCVYLNVYLQIKDEKGILFNQYGSERYAVFVQGLGQFFRLLDCNFDRVYIGGLDCQGKDGQFVYSWQDEFMYGMIQCYGG